MLKHERHEFEKEKKTKRQPPGRTKSHHKMRNVHRKCAFIDIYKNIHLVVIRFSAIFTTAHSSACKDI